MNHHPLLPLPHHAAATLAAATAAATSMETKAADTLPPLTSQVTAEFGMTAATVSLKSCVESEMTTTTTTITATLTATTKAARRKLDHATTPIRIENEDTKNHNVNSMTTCQCPHVRHHVRISHNDLQHHPQARLLRTSSMGSFSRASSTSSSSSSSSPETSPARPKASPIKEQQNVEAPWLCLECGSVLLGQDKGFEKMKNEDHEVEAAPLSRGRQHWLETQAAAAASDLASTEGHCLMMDVQRLSVWCHACQAYLQLAPITPPALDQDDNFDALEIILKRLKQLQLQENLANELNNNSTLLKEDDTIATAEEAIHNSSSHHVHEPERKRPRHESSVASSYDDSDEVDSKDESSVVPDSDDERNGASKDEGDHDSHEQEKEDQGSSDEDDEDETEEEEDDSNTDDYDGDNDGENERFPSDASWSNMSDQALLQLLQSVAAARGIPLQLLVEHMHGIHSDEEDEDDNDEDESIQYPFGTLPQNLQQVAAFIQSDQCRRIVVLAGAGMSVISGIPDYRSADGFYATLQADRITATHAEREAIRQDPTVALEQPMFLQNPLPCLELKRDFILGTYQRRWKATLAHRFVELLHTKTNKLVRWYTQNIDGLEDQCTSIPPSKIITVHGSMDRAECASCGAACDYRDFCEKVKTQIKDVTGKDPTAPAQSRPIPCATCRQGFVKPAIVLFRSSLPRQFFDSVPTDIEDADLLIVLGTSLRVAPANSLVWRVPKTCLRVLINRETAGEHLGMRFPRPPPDDDDYDYDVNNDHDARLCKRDYHAAGDCEDVVLDLMEHLGWLPDLAPLVGGGTDEHNNDYADSSQQDNADSKLPAPSVEKLRSRLARLNL